MPRVVAAVGGFRCPICREPAAASEEEGVLRLPRLIHERSPGRHTHLAQCDLAFVYALGEGVEQDDAEGVRLYKLAAEGGFSMAQYNLGICYGNGKGVVQDHGEAVRWFRAEPTRRACVARHGADASAASTGQYGANFLQTPSLFLQSQIDEWLL